MLTVFRRHLASCPHKKKGRKHKTCGCPIHMQGIVEGTAIRKALSVRDWRRANRIAMECEARGISYVDEPISVDQACSNFLADASARNLKEPTLYKYGLLIRRLKAFSELHGIRFIRQYDLELVRKFRATWPHNGVTAVKTIEALRSFFQFCQDGEYIRENPARKLKPPQITCPPTMPFDHEQIGAILSACDRYSGRGGEAGSTYSRRLRALVLLLLYSGLRIRDAVTLSRTSVKDGKLRLHTSKTGTVVSSPLPKIVVDALNEISPVSIDHYFWTGKSKPKSAVGDWQRSLKRFFRFAGVENGHAHRFRHTLAVTLLEGGIPMDRVSRMLGHQSVGVTEKHYAPWVRARQDQLEADVSQFWKLIDRAHAKFASTPQVRKRKPHAKHLKTKRNRWWRRGELNPRPRNLATRRLHA
jgi:integrase/recombinase XerD